MPARRKKSPGRSGIRLWDPTAPEAAKSIENGDLVQLLLYGQASMAGLLDNTRFSDEAEERETWRLNRELLLSLTTEDPGQNCYKVLVGNRPWAWWKYETDIPRVVVADPQRFVSYCWHDWQYAFLREQGLLRDGEAEAVARMRAKIEAATWRPPAPDVKVMKEAAAVRALAREAADKIVPAVHPLQARPAPAAASAADAAASEGRTERGAKKQIKENEHDSR